MFCSDLSLSHDYVEFLLGLGGPFVALLVGLARGRGRFCGVFLDVLLDTLDKMLTEVNARPFLDLPETAEPGSTYGPRSGSATR